MVLGIPVFWDDGVTYRLVKPYISGYKVPAYGGSMYEDVVVDTAHPEYPQERLSDGWFGWLVRRVALPLIVVGFAEARDVIQRSLT